MNEAMPTSTTERPSARRAVDQAIQLARGIRNRTWVELVLGESRPTEPARKATETDVTNI